LAPRHATNKSPQPLCCARAPAADSYRHEVIGRVLRGAIHNRAKRECGSYVLKCFHSKICFNNSAVKWARGVHGGGLLHCTLHTARRCTVGRCSGTPQRWNRVSGSPGHRVTGNFGQVGSGHGSVCVYQTRLDAVLSFDMRHYCAVVSTQ